MPGTPTGDVDINRYMKECQSDKTDWTGSPKPFPYPQFTEIVRKSIHKLVRDGDAFDSSFEAGNEMAYTSTCRLSILRQVTVDPEGRLRHILHPGSEYQ